MMRVICRIFKCSKNIIINTMVGRFCFIVVLKPYAVNDTTIILLWKPHGVICFSFSIPCWNGPKTIVCSFCEWWTTAIILGMFAVSVFCSNYNTNYNNNFHNNYYYTFDKNYIMVLQNSQQWPLSLT